MKNKYLYIAFILLSSIACKKANIESKIHSDVNVTETGITEDLDDLSFYDKNNGLCIGNPAIGNGHIIKTTDGGKTWSVGSCPIYGKLQSVFSFSSGIAYLLSDTILFRSTDGGSSWNILKTGRMRELHFTSDATGYVIYNDFIILKTADGGTNWNTTYNGLNQNISYFTRISCPNNFTVYAETYSCIYMKSTDGGVTWTKLPTFTSLHSQGIHFYSPSEGFVIFGQGLGVYKTADGGQSWHRVVYPEDDATIDQIYMADASIGFCRAQTGQTVYSMTNDGGETWVVPFKKTVGTSASVWIQKIIGFSDRTIYLACEDGLFAVARPYNLGE
jgi:photosystem II stability/assembly factor-like uncharacterized protein